MLSTFVTMGGILAPRSLVVGSLHRCIRVFSDPSELTNFTNLTIDAPRPIFGREENAMPIARAKSAKRRTVKIAADRVAGGGAFMLDGDAVTRTTIPIASKAIGTLSRNSQRVGQLIESFGAALERMQRTGRAFRLMVDVEPKGALKIREINSASEFRDHRCSARGRQCGSRSSARGGARARSAARRRDSQRP